jgi:ATP-dependent DNA ligase
MPSISSNRSRRESASRMRLRILSPSTAPSTTTWPTWIPSEPYSFHRLGVPNGDRWIHEIKFDGYRVQLHLSNDDIKVFTRRGNDWTKRFKKIAGDAYLINAGSAIIDGEVVVPAANGSTDFSVCCKTNSVRKGAAIAPSRKQA